VDTTTGIISTVNTGNTTLRYAQALSIDSSGNLYVTITLNHWIAKAPFPYGGTVEAVAGTDRGFSGDLGPATLAMLSGPTGTTVGASGNVYIADNGNCRVRLVTASTGIITTFAGTDQAAGNDGDGGPATSAGICGVRGVTLDNVRGVLYITQTLVSHVIRAVSLSTNIITTVVGKGDQGYSGDGGPATLAAVNNLYKLAVDSAGNLFVADGGNSAIRYVQKSTGIIYTIIGGNGLGSTGDGGPGSAAKLVLPQSINYDETNGKLYIADTHNFVVRVVSLACTPGHWSKTGSTPCTACAANTYNPLWGASASSVCVPCGVLQTSGIGAASCVSAIGNIALFAGSYSSGNSADGVAATSALMGILYGVAVDSGRGQVFIPDNTNAKIW
jgi:hypothetical protein